MKRSIRKLISYLDAAVIVGAAFTHGVLKTIKPGGFIASKAALCMDARTGDVLYSKARGKVMFPASTTKVMTALLLIEHAWEHGWGEDVKISEQAYYDIGPDASNIGLVPGDTLTIRECLYAILLASANEVCIAVAEHIAGSIENFTYMMNERALSVGAVDTYFTNPHGLPDENHVTTAYDIALIMREAIKERDFTAVISTPEYTVYPCADFKKPNRFKNRNKLIQSGLYRREYVVGGKTGYTVASRRTLVNYAVKDGVELICVVLHAPNYMTYPDTIALLEYGFSCYEELMPEDVELSEER